MCLGVRGVLGCPLGRAAVSLQLTMRRARLQALVTQQVASLAKQKGRNDAEQDGMPGPVTQKHTDRGSRLSDMEKNCLHHTPSSSSVVSFSFSYGNGPKGISDLELPEQLSSGGFKFTSDVSLLDESLPVLLQMLIVFARCWFA